MTEDDIREVVAQAVVENLVNSDVGRAVLTVQTMFVGCDEVRMAVTSKRGDVSIRVEAFRDGVSLGGFGS